LETPDNSLLEKNRSINVEINENLCKGCEICIDFCPLKVFEVSEKLNRKGYYIPLIANEKACNGCRLCELLCPDLAIIITKNKNH
jgi:2-oxoglutarate ferredoxin oxidoreductase subunit delta